MVNKVDKAEEFDNSPFLSGKPFFDIIISKAHMAPRYNSVLFPVRIHNDLPRVKVPAVLQYNCKNWHMTYVGSCVRPRFDNEWRKFLMDNNLAVGDACVFEVMESSRANIKFKVHILRNQLPPELAATFNSYGTAQNPIDLD